MRKTIVQIIVLIIGLVILPGCLCVGDVTIRKLSDESENATVTAIPTQDQKVQEVRPTPWPTMTPTPWAMSESLKPGYRFPPTVTPTPAKAVAWAPGEGLWAGGKVIATLAVCIAIILALVIPSLLYTYGSGDDKGPRIFLGTFLFEGPKKAIEGQGGCFQLFAAPFCVMGVFALLTFFIAYIVTLYK